MDTEIGRRSLLTGIMGSGLTLAASCAPMHGRPRRSRDLQVEHLAEQLTRRATTDREAAVALFCFVRDEIEFGFTAHFDQATPQQTLASGRGHCNPQGALFAALLRAIGIPARPHFVTIRHDIIADLFPAHGRPPLRINHSFVEVMLDGQWRSVDAYIADPPLFAGAKRALEKAGRSVGFGVHAQGTDRWDGREDAMVQFADPKMALADHGVFENAADFYRSEAYAQRLSWATRTMFGLFVVPSANASIERLRA